MNEHLTADDTGLAAILDATFSFIKKFVVLTDHQAIAIALWVAHTWVLRAFECTPYLHFTSPTKRTGKTRGLEVLAGC